MRSPERPFFIGWAGIPRGLRSFLLVIAAIVLGLFAAAGYLVAATSDDPGGGAFRYDWGQQDLTGRLTLEPYPVLHVQEAGRVPRGTSVMLSSPGKRGVQERVQGLDGQVVTASGVLLKRGDLFMLQVSGRGDALAPAGEGTPAPVPRSLGRWRLTGEICDGKCYAGAMRPGRGLAHKACANLCLSGGVPPVFVSTGPVEGERFLMLADANGGPVTSALLDHVAVLVEVEGLIERRGSLLVLRVDPDTLRVLH